MHGQEVKQGGLRWLKLTVRVGQALERGTRKKEGTRNMVRGRHFKREKCTRTAIASLNPKGGAPGGTREQGQPARFSDTRNRVAQRFERSFLSRGLRRSTLHQEPRLHPKRIHPLARLSLHGPSVRHPDLVEHLRLSELYQVDPIAEICQSLYVRQCGARHKPPAKRLRSGPGPSRPPLGGDLPRFQRIRPWPSGDAGGAEGQPPQASLAICPASSNV